MLRRERQDVVRAWQDSLGYQFGPCRAVGMATAPSALSQVFLAAFKNP